MMTFDQIRRTGLEVLARELGPVGMIRFIQQFEFGHGDYSIERHQWQNGDHVCAIIEKMK